MNKKVLLVTWDGAGNVAAMLSIGEGLVRAGHDVRLLGHSSLAARGEASGCRFVPFKHTAGWDSMVPVDLSDEVNDLARALLFNPEIGREVLAELDREQADVAVVDAMLLTAITAAQARVPTVSLFHTAMSIFRGGPLFDLLSPYVPSLNGFRAELGLGSVASFTEVHDAGPLSLIAVAREFEPDFPVPSNARYVGPMLDGPGLGIAPSAPPQLGAATHRVLVSLSSSYQGQLDVLREIAMALAGTPVEAVITTGNAIDPAEVPAAPNVVVTGYVPHEQVLSKVTAVVTHGGLGTVMAALAHGLPLLCMPMGRDQFFNAAMVERLGVGQSVPVDASSDDIRRAVQAVLEDESMRAAAKRFSGVVASCAGVAGAVSEIERASRRSA